MARNQTTSIRIDPEVWREAKKLAIDRNKTVGELLEELLKRELEGSKKGNKKR